MKKTTTLTLLLLLTTTLTTAQASENAGVKQEVNINIDRNLQNKTPSQKTELYCMQKNLNFCQKNPTPLDILIVASGKAEWFAQNIYNQKNQENKIQTIGQPTAPLN